MKSVFFLHLYFYISLLFMGKLSAILMSFTILFQSFGLDFNDFTNFPKLISHLSSHIEEGDDVSDFMNLHYGTDVEKHKNKHSEHKELPFKHQHSDTHLQLVYVLNICSLEMIAVENIYENKNFHYGSTFSNNYIKRLFQPPQK